MKSSEIEELRRASRMSPVIFFALSFALFYLGALAAAVREPSLVSWTLSAMAFGAVVALVWNRWVGPGAQWFVRACLLVILVALAAMVYEWLPRQDVFHGCGDCRVGTFWPLLMVWGAGIALVLAILWGTGAGWARLKRRDARAVLAWASIVAWSLACAWIFVRNISVAVLWASLAGPGKVVLVIGALLLVGFVLLSLASRATDRKRNEAAADFDRMGPEARAEVRALIEKQARRGEFALAYLVAGAADDLAASARIGGAPWLAPGEEWPRDEEGKPGLFLLQLPLDVPRLGEVWRQRFVTVFLVDWEIRARSYIAAEVTGRAPPLVPDAPENSGMSLESLAVPYVAPPPDDEDDNIVDVLGTAGLFARVKGLRAAVAQRTQHPDLLLNMLLANDARRYYEDGGILVGAAPEYIQGEHEPDCEVCGQRLRFLFQFADVTDDLSLGDAGVGYVYGCDAHPQHLQGFVDCL